MASPNMLMPYTATVSAIPGANASEFIGNSVASAGDVNGDGFDDLIVGAFLADEGGGNNNGAAYVFFGSQSPAPNISVSQADITLVGADNNDQFGNSVASLWDLNGDGIPDLLFESPRIHEKRRRPRSAQDWLRALLTEGGRAA